METDSLHNFFHCLTVFMVNLFSLYPDWTFLLENDINCLLSFHCAPLWKAWLRIFNDLSVVIGRSCWLTFSCPCSRLNQPRSLSPSSQGKYFSLPTVLVVLPPLDYLMFIDVTFASTAGCSIHMWSKECYLKGDKPSTCLNILAIFLLLQPMLLLTFFATGLCLAGGAHTSSFFFLQSCQLVNPKACVIVGASSFPGPGLGICSCWILLGFCQPLTPASQHVLEDINWSL